jgi:hypothetical protein
VEQILVKIISRGYLYFIEGQRIVRVSMTEENQECKSLEEETFEALVHQNRRDILRFVGEKKTTAFTEILNAVKISDSPTLAYHLRSLSQFIRQENGKYRLTPMGKDAYSLLLRTITYNKISFLKQRTHRVTFDNAVIWVAVIAAAVVLEVNTILSTVILPGAAVVSLVATYRLFDDAERGCLPVKRKNVVASADMNPAEV